MKGTAGTGCGSWMRGGGKKDKLIKRHFIILHDLAIKQMQPHEKDESVFTVYNIFL